MSTNIRTRKFHWLGSAAVAALALFAVSVPLTPAKAFIGVDVGGIGVGIGGPYGYYPPPPRFAYDSPYYYGYGPGYYRYGW